MGHHYNFLGGNHGSNLPDNHPLRLFIRKHRKIILFVSVLVILLALFLAVVAVIFFFKIIVPAFSGAATSPTAQTGFAIIKNGFYQLVNTNPLQWISLITQAG